MKKFLIILSVLYGGFCGMARACESNEIDVLGDGTQCKTAKFTITTTNLSNDTRFAFYMSASGTFYVDWGDGTVDTIVRNDTNETLYSHTYTAGGVKTIRFGGLATGYSTDIVAAIRFGSDTTDDATASLVAIINGSLGAIFPTLGNNHDIKPKFVGTLAKTSIKTIPESLFNGIKNAGYYMFYYTFLNCWRIESIPKGLFSDIKGGARSMFRYTFFGCTGLTAIPEVFFSGIDQSYDSMFYYTFYGCGKLKGYIPPSTFKGLVAAGSPTATNMWDSTFSGTGSFATSCPSGTVQFVTGYEDYWGGKVSCVDENLTCNAGEYLPAHWFKCEPCPQNNYCPGGTYPYSETIPSGAISCPNNLYAPAGMSSLTQCGRILHIGENVVYLHSVKKTTPALHVDIDQDGTADYFGNMTTLDVPMTRGTDKKLKLQYDGVTYSVYDDSIIP